MMAAKTGNKEPTDPKGSTKENKSINQNVFTNDDKAVNKSCLYLTSACHAESFLWVDEAYPGARPGPGPSSNHTKSGGGVEHGAAKSLVLVFWSYWQALSHPFHILCGSIGRTGQVVFFYIDYICAFMRLARLPTTTNIKNNGS